MDRFLENMKKTVTGFKAADEGAALTACGIKDQNPECGRKDGYEEREDEDGYEYRVEAQYAYEQALDDTTPEEVKLVARCLLRHRLRLTKD